MLRPSALLRFATLTCCALNAASLLTHSESALSLLDQTASTRDVSVIQTVHAVSFPLSHQIDVDKDEASINTADSQAVVNAPASPPVVVIGGNQAQTRTPESITNALQQVNAQIHILEAQDTKWANELAKLETFNAQQQQQHDSHSHQSSSLLSSAFMSLVDKRRINEFNHRLHELNTMRHALLEEKELLDPWSDGLLIADGGIATSSTASTASTTRSKIERLHRKWRELTWRPKPIDAVEEKFHQLGTTKDANLQKLIAQFNQAHQQHHQLNHNSVASTSTPTSIRFQNAQQVVQQHQMNEMHLFDSPLPPADASSVSAAARKRVADADQRRARIERQKRQESPGNSPPVHYPQSEVGSSTDHHSSTGQQTSSMRVDQALNQQLVAIEIATREMNLLQAQRACRQLIQHTEYELREFQLAAQQRAEDRLEMKRIGRRAVFMELSMQRAKRAVLELKLSEMQHTMDASSTSRSHHSHSSGDGDSHGNGGGGQGGGGGSSSSSGFDMSGSDSGSHHSDAGSRQTQQHHQSDATSGAQGHQHQQHQQRHSGHHSSNSHGIAPARMTFHQQMKLEQAEREAKLKLASINRRTAGSGSDSESGSRSGSVTPHGPSGDDVFLDARSLTPTLRPQAQVAAPPAMTPLALQSAFTQLHASSIRDPGAAPRVGGGGAMLPGSKSALELQSSAAAAGRLTPGPLAPRGQTHPLRSQRATPVGVLQTPLVVPKFITHHGFNLQPQPAQQAQQQE